MKTIKIMDYIGEESTALSSSNLFHYTPKLEYLLGIIEWGFKPRFCKEMYSFFDGSGEEGEEELSVQGVPMVCFCDIPIDLSANHKNTYGDYAIVMTKSWGIRNGIQPVWYMTDDFGSKNITKIILDSLRYDDSNPFFVQRMMHFIKQYSGSYKREFVGLDKENYKFYDEREWRYIPHTMSGRSKLSKLEIHDIDFVKENDLYQEPLLFDEEDVVNIIVNTEDEKRKAVEALHLRAYGDLEDCVKTWSELMLST